MSSKGSGSTQISLDIPSLVARHLCSVVLSKLVRQFLPGLFLPGRIALELMRWRQAIVHLSRSTHELRLLFDGDRAAAFFRRFGRLVIKSRQR